MAGVGIDLLEIERLERALERRPSLAERIFTLDERAYAQRRKRPGRHLAARFCGKEAVAKALGLTAWSFTDVEIVGDGGRPVVRLTGAAADAARERALAIDISLTHTDVTAGAVAIALPAAGSRG